MSHCGQSYWNDAAGTTTDLLSVSGMKAHGHCCANSDKSEFVELIRNVRNTSGLLWNTGITCKLITNKII